MRFISLTVENYGLFDGTHVFDLAPVTSRPSAGVVLFRGHNGAGKSTVFGAFGLAMHGMLSIGDRVSSGDYSQFLYRHLHRRLDVSTGRARTSDTGALRLTLEYVQSGTASKVQVWRRWRRRGHAVDESLDVWVNGVAPVGIAREDYQHFLNDLFPPGVAPLCFFDAERLERPAVGTTSHQSGLRNTNPMVRDAMRRLFGLDVVERLQADLDLYISRNVATSGKASVLRDAVLLAQDAVDKRRLELQSLESAAETIQRDEAECRSSLAAAEARLIDEGGAYAARLPALQSRLADVETELANAERQVDDACSGDLPFAMAPSLCRRLADRLVREADLERQELAGEFWRERRNRIARMLKTGALFDGLEMPSHSKAQLFERLNSLLYGKGGDVDDGLDGTDGRPSRSELIHPMSNAEREKLQEWLSGAMYAAPTKAGVLLATMDRLNAEREQIHADLGRVPHEAAIAPLHAEVLKMRDALAQRHKANLESAERVGSAKYQLTVAERALHKAVEALERSAAENSREELAMRSRMALRGYHEALLAQRLAALERAFLARFNGLCRKEQLLSSATIDPVAYSFSLLHADGSHLDVASFSAGEQQLCQLAILQALRDVSRRELPLAIDTPVARLDDDHRDRFISAYVPEVSDQVLLFGTDAELREDVLDSILPLTARRYDLRFDPVRQCSEATATEAWQPQLPLPLGGRDAT